MYERSSIKNEKRLLMELRKGNHYAFEQIYDAYYFNLTGHILRILKSTELAKEVVQDTFMACGKREIRLMKTDLSDLICSLLRPI